jgi:tRNA A-37 threonylcarbamoyl transferase component Bud32
LDDGRSLFLKIPQSERREGSIIATLRRRDELADIHGILPTLVHYDEELNIVVTSGLSEYKPMRDLCRWRPPGDGPLVREVGSRLARLHSATSKSSTLPLLSACPLVKNPVPSYGNLSPADLARAPGRDFPRFLAAVQEVNEELVDLHGSWQPECVIHGDFKDDNVMVEDRPEGPKLVFIDWEMAGWGDPLWDVGSMVGQFLYHWVMSIKPITKGDFASLVEAASVPFADVRSSAAGFVTSYAAATTRDFSLSTEWVMRVLQFAGLFLLHRVRATLDLMGVLAGPVINCLYVGRTLVRNPQRSGSIVLGLV